MELNTELTPFADGWLTLSVEGEVDLSNVGVLEEVLQKVFEDRTDHLVVDLTDTSFMDSTGLRSLILSGQRFGEAGRSLALVVSPGPISRLIDVTGLGDSVRIVSEPDEVLANGGSEKR
jgi:anti-sigma B factor antagonist